MFTLATDTGKPPETRTRPPPKVAPPDTNCLQGAGFFQNL